MPYLIATDEAGYGPTLGPLVVSATLWQFESGHSPESAFACWQDGYTCANGAILRLADSKQLFRRHAHGALAGLEVPLWLMLHSINGDAVPSSLAGLLGIVAPQDLPVVQERPWFKYLDVPFPADFASAEFADEVLSATLSWIAQGPDLKAISARVIDAQRFNEGCEAAGNKACLLSETTLALAKQLIDRVTADPVNRDRSFIIKCDRHGGRRNYLGLVLNLHPESFPQVVCENAKQSQYRVVTDGMDIIYSFDVKGDSFPPVAFSSMVAKYLRERLMERFNEFWKQHHAGPLRPTAGYPQDATRFCREIASTAKRLGIATNEFMRAR